MPIVLLVDDDESTRGTLGVLLEDDGFVVHAARSSSEARAVIAGAIPVDLVLLDQYLGDGLGLDLVPLIRDRLPRARVVLMSGNVDTPTLPEEVDSSFTKGEPFDDLARLLRGLLPR